MTIIELIKGTNEYVYVDTQDPVGGTVDISLSVPVWSLYDSAGTAILEDQAADVIDDDDGNPMRVRCLVDTTVTEIDELDPGKLRLYVKITNATEAPLLGPIYILLKSF